MTTGQCNFQLNNSLSDSAEVLFYIQLYNVFLIDHFSDPVRAIGRVCVCVSGQKLLK